MLAHLPYLLSRNVPCSAVFGGVLPDFPALSRFLSRRGLIAGLLDGLEAFVKHFLLRFLLSRRGDFPWNLIPFLDEAADRLLLRKVGGSYIFVHRMLLDYFAELEEKDGSHRPQ